MYLELFGWRVHGALPKVPKAVFIGSPHTSNWRAIFLLACAWACGMRLSWLVKHTAVQSRFGW